MHKTRLKHSPIRVRQILLALAAIFLLTQLTACAVSLHDAAKAGDIIKVRSMLDSGADVNAKDNIGVTPLYFAAHLGRAEIVKLLIKQGADVNAKDQSGKTPLYGVARFGHAEIAKLLIKQGADVNAKDNIGVTPLYFAAQLGRAEIAKLLIKQGADVNAKSNDGWTPLHYAVPNGHAQIARLLIKQGADVNAKDNTGWTSMHWATMSGNAEIAKLLIKQGADVNAKSNEGKTALDLARQKNKLEIVAVLQTAVAESRAIIQKQQAKAKKKHIAKLKRKQKCKMKESKWIYNSKSCRKGYAHGNGTAVHADGNLKFVGTIKNGVRVSGELFYDDQPMFDGSIAKGKPSGNGICYYENEPEECKFYRGKRVDSIYKQRIALAKQNAKQQAEMQKLRADMKKDISALKTSQAAAGGTQTDSMGNVIKKDVTRRVVNELFNQLF